MKNLRVMIASLLMVATTASVMTSCKNEAEEVKNDGEVNAAAIVQVGNPAGAPGAVTTINVNTTWTSTNTYIINGYVQVVSPATLTIQPGTTIQGDRATRGTLVIAAGGKINATGTAAQPIVFTSEFAAGSRKPGDWGGVIICGNANVNVGGLGNGTFPAGSLPATKDRVEGLIYTTDATIGLYGTLNSTANDAENSGVFKYCRIEYAGVVQTTDNETNGLTLAGVGNGTTIDHVEVAYSNDDAFEWFGGTVNAKYLFSYRNRDDDFDTDFGYQGEVQFGWALRDPALADNNKTDFTGAFIAGSGSNGFESDNNNVSGGNTNNPRTQPVFVNMTIIGPDKPSGANPATAGVSDPYTAGTYSAGYITASFANGGYGTFIRRQSLESLYNSVVVGWPSAQYNFVTPAASFSTAGTFTLNSLTTARNSTVVHRSDLAGRSSFNAAVAFLTAALSNSALSSANLQTTLGVNAAFWSLTAPNAKPIAGSVLLTNPALPTASLPSTNAGANGAFTAANFRGAFDTAGTGWDLGTSWLRYFNYGL